MDRWGVSVLALAGCTVGAEGSGVSVEPAFVELDLELGRAREIQFHAWAGGAAAADAVFTLEGGEIGQLADSRLTVSGQVGGAAEIVVSVNDETVRVPVEVWLHSTRSLRDTPADAADRFSTATDMPHDARLEPGDQAVLPPSLGNFEINFLGESDAVAHEIAVIHPYLDVRVYAPGSPGAGRIALSAEEWQAISRTARGDGVELAMRTLRSSQPSVALSSSSHVAISDVDLAGSLLFGAFVPPIAELFRYSFASASVERWATGPEGGCVGCHVAVAGDGARIAAATADASGAVGLTMDAETRELLNQAGPVQRWTSAAFDPGGLLLTSAGGVITLRDGSTAAELATIATEVPVTLPTVSPDGGTLAYAVLDPSSPSTVGRELHTRAWDAGTRAVGPPRVVIPADPAGRGIKEPTYSPDGEWLLYSRTQTLTSRGILDGVAVVRADGTGTIELSDEPSDGLARWISELVPTRADGGSPERMGWIAITSHRPIGTPEPTANAQLWLVPFYPDRAAFGRPVLLPGQDRGLTIVHAPRLLPF